MFEKHLWKSAILSKDAGHRPASLLKMTVPQVFFKHFASENQLPGLSVSGTLVENGLRIFRTIFNYCIFGIVAFSEPWHI